MSDSKPTLSCERKNFAKFARALSSRIFLVVNQLLLYGCYNNMGLDKAYLWKLVMNQFISSKSQNNVANKSSLRNPITYNTKIWAQFHSV